MTLINEVVGIRDYRSVILVLVLVGNSNKNILSDKPKYNEYENQIVHIKLCLKFIQYEKEKYKILKVY